MHKKGYILIVPTHSIEKYNGNDRRLTKAEQTCAFHGDVEVKIDKICKKVDTLKWFILINIALSAPDAVSKLIRMFI